MTDNKKLEPVAFEDFRAWLAKEMPADTVIGDPDWWARHIYKRLLRATPPAREWVGLTDEELTEMHHIEQFGLFCDEDEFHDIARAIEAALKRRNT